MSIPSNHALARTALDVLRERYLAALTKPLSLQYVEFSVDAPASKLVIQARAYSLSANDVSSYTGSHRATYLKANLNRILPHPIHYPNVYPTTVGALRQVLQQRYNLLIEEREFALTSGQAMGLPDSHLLTASPDPKTNVLTFYATENSGRWLPNGQLKLVLTQRKDLAPAQYFDFVDALDLNELTLS